MRLRMEASPARAPEFAGSYARGSRAGKVVCDGRRGRLRPIADRPAADAISSFSDHGLGVKS